MTFSLRNLISGAALAAGLFAQTAGAAEMPGAPSGALPVELVFAAKAGDEALVCGRNFRDIGKTHATIFMQDFRVYVSAVRLISQDGREVPVSLTPDSVWQDDRVTLLDFENASGNCNGNAAMNDRVRGTVPAGKYRGVVFEIGVPFELNHQDPTLAPAPLNYSALTWPWSIGYKFTTIDFDTAVAKAGAQPAAAAAMSQRAHAKSATDKSMAGAGRSDGGVPGAGVSPGGMAGGGMTGMSVSHAASPATGFSVHLGSTECASKGPRVPPAVPCGNPNRPTYRFESFDPQTQRLVMNLASLLAGTDVTANMPGSSSGCMSFPKDDDCIDIMNRFGLTFRGQPSSGQRFIRAEAR